MKGCITYILMMLIILSQVLYGQETENSGFKSSSLHEETQDESKSEEMEMSKTAFISGVVGMILLAGLGTGLIFGAAQEEKGDTKRSSRLLVECS